MEVDDVQMGHDEETGRRTILVEPGVGGLADGMVALAGVKAGCAGVKCACRMQVPWLWRYGKGMRIRK